MAQARYMPSIVLLIAIEPPTRKFKGVNVAYQVIGSGFDTYLYKIFFWGRWAPLYYGTGKKDYYVNQLL